jgi:spermidine synthase
VAPETRARVETPAEGKGHDLPTTLLAFFFFGSGFSAVSYLVMISRYTQLIVGFTAQATSALLVAFMLGFSIGSIWGGRLADRSSHPMRVYAATQGFIGLYALLFPLLFPAYQQFYVWIAPPVGESLMLRNLVRFLMGLNVFLLPSILMGVATPAFAKAVAARRREGGRWLVRLCGWNGLGAAAGAFACAHVLVPRLGLIGGILIVSILNFATAILAYLRWLPHHDLEKRPRPEARHREKRTTDSSPLDVLRLAALRDLADLRLDRSFLRKAAPLARRLGRDLLLPNLARPAINRGAPISLIFAFLSGFTLFALGVLWMHLFTILLGSSVYSFRLVLGSLLLGYAVGALTARRLTKPRARAWNGLAIALALAGFWVLSSLGTWDLIPGFLLLANTSPSFFSMELARSTVALLWTLLPAASFGTCFALLLPTTTTRDDGFGRRVGQVYAAGTAGAALGALSGSYIILPGLGSLDGLRCLGAGLLAVGGAAILLIGSIKWRKTLALVAVSALIWVWDLPASWDFEPPNMPGAVHLGSSMNPERKILYQKEDATVGLTNVIEENGRRGLFTNRTFQGDNRETLSIGNRLANIPTLFTRERQRALVIGLGTGVTLAAIAAHGFADVVCTEIRVPVIEAVKAHFKDANQGILDQPSVEILPEDGRSVLLERPDRYDVISVGSGITWRGGLGSLYTREFYQLASKRLRRNGVLLQRFPIHRLSPRNLFVLVNTVHSVFPNVSLWTHRQLTFVVASNEPLRVDLDSVRTDQKHPMMQPFLQSLESGSPLEILSDLVLTDNVNRFLDMMAGMLRADRSLVSTDTRPVLEYEIPKDILENFSYLQNRAVFRRFRDPRPFDFRGKPTDGERQLAETAFSLGWQDPRALPRLARLWAEHPDYSSAASEWLLDELIGRDAIADFPSDPLSALRREMTNVGSLTSSALAEAECIPFPRFVSRLARAPLRAGSYRGEALDGTAPEAAVDGVFRPELGTGWRIRPLGGAARLDLVLDRPRRIGRVHLVVEPVDGSLVRTRLFGRDESGRWRPLASGSGGHELVCRTVRRFRLDPDWPKLTDVRIELQGEALSHRMTLHEVWAFEPGRTEELP